MMPASVKKQYKQLSISICEAHHLPKMDMMGGLDAYLYLDYNDFKYQSSVITGSNIIKFYETFLIPIPWPCSKDKLHFTVWDQDSGSSDEIVGSLDFSVRELVENCSNPEGQFRWRHIYGAHTGLFDGPYMSLMNHNNSVASLWKGRVLFHLKIEDCKSPL